MSCLSREAMIPVVRHQQDRTHTGFVPSRKQCLLVGWPRMCRADQR